MRHLLRTLGTLLAILLRRLTQVTERHILRHIRTGYIAHGMLYVGRCTVFAPRVRIDGRENISIGDFTTIGTSTILSTWYGVPGVERPRLEIGSYVSIPENCHITAARHIRIGNHVLIGKQVTITDNAHGLTTPEQLMQPPARRALQSKGPVVIGDNVWIGDKATILPGVTIGEGSIIGANSVVTHDVPPQSIVVGNPAHKL